MSSLPNEMYQQIFSYIQDTTTLYSIIQVNHVWCKNCIVILWKKPFRKEISLNNHAKIIPIFLSYFKKDKNTLFNYSCFITHLDFDNLFRIVSEFFKTNGDDVEYVLDLMKDDSLRSIFYNSENNYKQPGLGQICFIILLILVNMAKGGANLQWFKFDIKYNDIKSFLNINEESEMEYFDVDDDRIVGSDISMRYNIVNRIEDIFKDFLKLDNLKFFENIEYLELGRSSIKKAILEAFSICENLKTIEIEHPYFQWILEPLVSLIKNQNGLENIIIYGVHKIHKSDYDKTIFEIISSLDSVAHSLRKIEICGVKMMNGETFRFICKCENLEDLKLVDSFISIKNFEWIASADLPKLCFLELAYTFTNKEYVNQFNPYKMILQNKKISTNLKKLHLLNIHVKNHDLLKTINENCKNLINFTTQLTADNDIKYLFTILENNQNLKELQLLYPGTYPGGGYSINLNTEFIINLAKALPRKTDYVRLVNIINSVDDCGKFLENCMVDLKFLYIVVSINNDIDEFGECVKKWSEDRGKKIKNLEKFSIPSDKKILIRWE